jgi:glycine/D-amino acid oxidase-like deaminating enzyme/Pyruvate/2-oxoacid:ferredoxin oxidoreductase delta subunit/bacterioferritin-associated ferredoxin
MTVNGNPNVMTCITLLDEGMEVRTSDPVNDTKVFKRLPTRKIDISPSGLSQSHPKCDIAIIGAGPAGLEAAISAHESGVESIVLFDDKDYLGGQLALQTHTFFGTEELGASIRGYEIANLMKKEIQNSNIDVRLNSTVIGLFPNNILGFRDEDRLNFIEAKKIICATGASEKFLAFDGNHLPGVIGAGGAQTFMNIYGIKPGHNVLIIGGGNIGVILAYQLAQSGIKVAGIVEASEKPGAYEVHIKKIETLGIPIFSKHSILKAHGKDKVEAATICKLDDNWMWVNGTEQTFPVDTICLAVGLNPLSELLWQAGCEFVYNPDLGEVPKFNKYYQTSISDIFIAGDCAVIGEASIARLEGRIAGSKAALDLGHPHNDFNKMIDTSFELLGNIQTGTYGNRLGLGKSLITNTKPININFEPISYNQKIGSENFTGNETLAIINCDEDIPCNPCAISCKFDSIKINKNITQQPTINYELCKGCGLCLPKCPGRAIRMLQYNFTDTESLLTIPFEFEPYPKQNQKVSIVNYDGNFLANGTIQKTKPPKSKTDCGTISIIIPKKHAFDGIMIQIKPDETKNTKLTKEMLDKLSNAELANFQDAYVCRCEEVKMKDILSAIKQGYKSINEIKRITRAGMGACRGLSCTSLIEGLLKKEFKFSPKDILQVKQKRRTIFRPPIKRITLGEAAKLKFTKEEIQKFEQIEKSRTIPQEIINTYCRETYCVDKNHSSKIIIIGGGISGIFTAWWLAQLGETDVTVIEKDFLSSGATGACLGGIRAGFNTPNKVKRAQKGLETFQKAKELIGNNVGWFQGGYVYLAFDENQDQLFKDSIPTWDKSKVKFTYTKNKCQFDQFVPGINNEAISSLVYFPESGGANPFSTVYKFAEDAKSKGVNFIINKEVIDIITENNKIKAVIAKDSQNENNIQISCEHVINAAGTGCVRISKMAGIDLSDQIWIERHGAFITEKMPLWLDPLVVSYHPTLSGYWQQKHMEEGLSDGEIVACYSAAKPLKGFNTHSYIYFLSRMAKSILLCQPALKDVGIVRNLAEHYVGRKSGIPIIGKTHIKGYWHNIAKKGHGFMCAPGDSYALAVSLLENKTHEWIEECTLEEQLDSAETMK